MVKTTLKGVLMFAITLYQVPTKFQVQLRPVRYFFCKFSIFFLVNVHVLCTPKSPFWRSRNLKNGRNHAKRGTNVRNHPILGPYKVSSTTETGKVLFFVIFRFFFGKCALLLNYALCILKECMLQSLPKVVIDGDDIALLTYIAWLFVVQIVRHGNLLFV